jgi:DnaT-like ssDNA binding protein
MPFDATPGSAAANSYAAKDEYLDYWSAKLIPDGQAAPDSFGDFIEVALMQATAEIDLEGWLGERAGSDQSLEWPRRGIYYRSGLYVDPSSIPQKIKIANIELAYYRLLKPKSSQPDGLDRFSRISVGQGELDLTIRAGAGSGGIPGHVTRLLSEFLSGRGASVYRA